MALSTDALTLEITRRFKAPPAKVFDAWLSPLWARWLPPGDVTCELVVMEPHVGGRYHARMCMPDGRTVSMQGEYLEIARPNRLVLTWRRDNDPQATVITVTFRADGGGTLLNLCQEGFSDPEMHARHNQGWGGERGSFDKLEALLSAEG